jgi:pimeloyl-ACP methyl ester carboxylesterase
VSAPGAPPIVVIGTTNDPATPLSGATALADQLPDARLVVFEGEGHTAYGRSDCVDDAVDEYLLTLNPPPDGMRCS